MSLSLTLKADLLWKQTHIPLFLPGCLLRTGNDCRELCFVPHVRLDEIHGAEHNHTKQQHEHTQPLDGVPHPEVPPTPQSSSQPSGLCGPLSTRTIQPSRCCLSGPAAKNPSPNKWDKCAEEDWHRSARLAVRSNRHTSAPPYTPLRKFLLSLFCSPFRGWSLHTCFLPIASFA